MKKYITLLIAVVILGGGAYFSQEWFAASFPLAEISEEHTPLLDKEGSREEPSSVAPPDETAEVSSPDTFAEITFDPSANSYVIPIHLEGTVLDAMYAYAAISDFTFEGRDFLGLGFFVEEVGGMKNAGGFYWTLFINNTLSEKGASSAEVIPGDIVEWRYQKGI